MKVELQRKVDLFVTNYHTVHKEFAWEYNISQRFAALFYAMEDKEIDVVAIKEAKRIIKENTGVFSQFKGVSYFLTAVLLSLENNLEEILQKSIHIYDQLKTKRFFSSNYLVLSSIVLAKSVEEYDYKRVIDRAEQFYCKMKEQHRFITSQEDYCFAVMLGMSDLEVDLTISEMEKAYGILKENLYPANAVQALTHIITFGEEEVREKCHRVFEIYQRLKERDCKLSGNEISALGVISLITDEVELITEDIVETSMYLKEIKGFGVWSINKSIRTMFAANLVASDYVDKIHDNVLTVSLQNNITSIIMAQQAAIIGASAAAASAAASSSSSSNS